MNKPSRTLVGKLRLRDLAVLAIELGTTVAGCVALHGWMAG